MNLNVLEILMLSAKILGVLLSRSEFLKQRSNAYTFFAGMDSFPGVCFASTPLPTLKVFLRAKL